MFTQLPAVFEHSAMSLHADFFSFMPIKSTVDGKLV